MVLRMLKKRLGTEAIEKDWMEKLTNYFKIPSTLIISEGCEKIGKYVFLCCNKLEEVVIPGSVKEIGYGVFWDCKYIRKVTILDGCRLIGDRSFSECDRLDEFVIPKSVKKGRRLRFFRVYGVEESSDS